MSFDLKKLSDKIKIKNIKLSYEPKIQPLLKKKKMLSMFSVAIRNSDR